MTRALFLLAACFASLSVNAAPLTLDELPAKYCANAASVGIWTDAPGHCRFALEGADREIAVVSINGVEVRALRRSTFPRFAKGSKTFFFGPKGRIKVSLVSRVIEDTCGRTRPAGCRISRTGTLMVWSPKGRAILPLSRYDGA